MPPSTTSLPQKHLLRDGDAEADASESLIPPGDLPIVLPAEAEGWRRVRTGGHGVLRSYAGPRGVVAVKKGRL